MGNRWPVTVSVVVLCDLYVCLMRWQGKYCFPWAIVDWGEQSTEDACTEHLRSIISLDTVDRPVSWLPVDIRSVPGRPSFLPEYSIDIGYMTILASPDLCDFLHPSEFEWQLVNLEEDKFPKLLCSDHEQLWKASIEMVRIIR